ncbi:uv-endonuclease uve-1 [Grosmannia clavigera kw1407]|uniref:Uv-endonuclease uve-1 n=1 Tax=Grosmannia clavigera (strain kw1407 / UAMH 11150) TaxID=655863 RepID=F0XMS7_GROCL|nr:uv-endonuclease uve-1 [Grosmannia clavigera kw1407]EFX01524.1 uv-endonuclease uve-1 [Grosmannia clavigera kw1407]
MATKRTRARLSSVRVDEDDVKISAASTTVIKEERKSTRASKRIKSQATGKDTTYTPIATTTKPKTTLTTKAKVDVVKPGPRLKYESPLEGGNLPLPWKGRLGYACLNTYLRTATPPVFCSRTCRLSSILEQRHPLQDPEQPPHRTKNRPDRTQPADTCRGQRYVEALGLANARDLAAMLRWNERFGIRFLRLSSDMFPFASHGEHGYALAPFAAETLAAAGCVAAKYGHRLTTHPGQYTQLGSPREDVVTAALRDLAYHAEMLRLLQLPPQQDRDAVMILHMGGVFGDKAATLRRFTQVYREKLTDEVRARLVLENDDVAWSVHDLLPVCEELGIPLVLDYHHHSIVHVNNENEKEGDNESENEDADLDTSPPSVAARTDLAARIRATWTAKGITPKMHYSEPSAGPLATPHQRRKHSARVVTLPPCLADADLMIEAKDKEQAVFDLMRRFQLPGFERIGDVPPHERDTTAVKNFDGVDVGGPEGLVYWPEGHEDWLKPKKKSRKVEDKEEEDKEEEE